MAVFYKRRALFRMLMVALALTPAVIFAYLGQFSRLTSDDYCEIGIAREMGAWGYTVDNLNNWAGSYSNWFFKGAAAPLDVMAVRITPALIVILWLVGLFWLIDEGLAHLKVSHSRRPLALVIAALAAAAAISSLPAPLSFYWYSINVKYTLPLALLTMYLAMTLWLAKRTRLPACGLMAGAALCFITAGAAEIYVVFQLVFLMFCLLASLAWRSPAHARVLGVGWLATLVGLVIQLNSPGIAIRAATLENSFARPDRSLLTLLSRSLGLTYEYIGYPQIFAGFVLLLAVGLLVMLFTYRPPQTLKTSQPLELVLSALWLCLIFQLLFAPILWLHTSNIPQFLGRFSPRYMVVIGLNLAFILSFAVLLWRRRRINAYLQSQERGLLILCGGLLLIFVFLFAITRLPRVYHHAASYLFMTALMFLGLLCWHLSSLLPGAETRKFGLLALCSLIIGLVCMAVIVGTISFGHNLEILRPLSPASYLLTLSGLTWGLFLGYLVKHLPSQYSQALKLGGLAMTLIIMLGIMLGQAALASDFQRYAQEWDARHLDIIAQRDSGQKAIKTAPLSYDIMTRNLSVSGSVALECAKRYYDVDSIVYER